MRKGLNHLSSSGAADGQIPVWNAAAQEWEPTNQNASGITGLTSADSSVTITDNGDGTLDLAAAGGGGGGGGASVPLDPASLNATYGDHFTGASLAGKWSRIGYVAGDEQYATGGGTWLEVDTPRGAANYWYQTAPAGNFTIVVKMLMVKGGAVMFGPLILDNSGNGVAAIPYNAPDAMLVGSVAAGSYGSASQNDGGTIHNTVASGQPVWLRLNKTGTAYKAAASTNGLMWRKWTPTLTSAITPTRIGFGGILGTAAQVAVDWFDVQ